MPAFHQRMQQISFSVMRRMSIGNYIAFFDRLERVQRRRRGEKVPPPLKIDI